MPRKKRVEEHENLERWLVSYADFITLLFAFFVVMYSISSINEGKYRLLSDTLISAFNTTPKALQPIQVGEEGLEGDPDILEPDKVRPGPAQTPDPLRQIAEDFGKAILPFINDDMVTVNKTDQWVEVEINSQFLFASGSAWIEDEAVPILQRLAEVLRKYPNQIQVEGFTDNVPIHTEVYPSNWELSAGRAASVVHLFMDEGVKPERMAATGFGEYQPKADNATPEGRRKNRRVVVVVLADAAARRELQIKRGAAAKQARAEAQVAQ